MAKYAKQWREFYDVVAYALVQPTGFQTRFRGRSLGYGFSREKAP